MDDTSIRANADATLNLVASDRSPFSTNDDIRRERKPPDRNILDRERIIDGLKEWGLPIVFAAILITFSILRPSTFMTAQNAINVINNSSSLLLFSLAATLSLVIGEFDLSFVAVADLVGILVGILVTSYGWTSGAAILCALVFGLVCGAAIGIVNGLFVAKAFVPSFVTTLAVGSIAAGLELALQGGIYAARQIDKRIKGDTDVRRSFKYRDLGTAAYISRFNAVVEIGPFKFWGMPGWWIWGLIHIAMLSGVPNRIGAVLSWLFHITRDTRHERAITPTTDATPTTQRETL